MLVREAMTSPAVTVREDDTVRYAAQLLLRHRIASAPVLNGLGALCGMVSEADLLRGRTVHDPRVHAHPVADEGEPPPSVVAEVMSTRVLPVRSTDDVADAARLLLDHGIKALPVLEGHVVVGVLARRDLLRQLARPDEDVRRDVLGLLGDLEQGAGWEVDVEDGVVRVRGAHDAREQRIAAVLARTVPGVVRVVLAGEEVESIDTGAGRPARPASGPRP